MQPLATPADVAGSLGLTENQLSASQTLRIPLILARLNGEFRQIAGCEFTPGTTTVRLLSVDGRITLPDMLNGYNEDGSLANEGSVASVQNYRDGKAVDFTLVGQDVLPTRPTILGTERAGTGTLFVVTYTHYGTVPEEVSSALAAACARYLTVDPKSAVAQSTFLSSEGYHQRMATWVADTVKLSATDIALAESYRTTPVTPIVAKMGGHHDASGWDESWRVGSDVIW